MKKLLLSVLGLIGLGSLSAQTYPYVDINQISFVSQQALVNCVDTSAFLGDTIVTRGVVTVDGSLSEVASGSISGGSRPFIALNDTANGGTGGSFQSVIVMGVNLLPANNTPNSVIENALAGDILEMTCVVSEFGGGIQLQPLDNSSVSFIGFVNTPAPIVINAGDIQDNQRRNVLPTGEQWEGAYVELQNVTVTNVSVFSNGNRTEFTVQDAAGNQVLIADRFLGMKVNGVTTVNPLSPQPTGRFVAPSVGTVYNYIRGIIVQDENGCAGGGNFAGGYEVNPLDSNSFDKAASPPTITNVQRNPIVPNATQSVTVSADIIDNDGTVTAATLFYTADQTAAANLFQSVSMTNTGSLYTATIPSFPLDSVVRYYIEAVDNNSQVTTAPNTPTGQPLNTSFYTVRPNGPAIMDIQFVPDVSDGDSKIEGDTITVTGIVTASYQTGDLGYLYIQDPTATEFAGIFCEGGPLSVFGFNRGEEVTVRGIVREQFGFTKLEVLTASATGQTGVITPIVINPSDPAFFGQGADELERYESMLVRYENPNGLIFVNDSLGFGEYTVGSGTNPTVDARVLAGRQSGTQAQSSLDVSYIADTATYGAGLNVTPIKVDQSFSMTALEGMMYYSFSNFKLTPRNNADFKNLAVSVETIFNAEVETVIYPNPAADQVTIQIDDNYAFNNLSVLVMDVTGRLVIETGMNASMDQLDLTGLEKGIYVIRINDNNELIHSSKLILK